MKSSTHQHKRPSPPLQSLTNEYPHVLTGARFNSAFTCNAHFNADFRFMSPGLQTTNSSSLRKKMLIGFKCLCRTGAIGSFMVHEHSDPANTNNTQKFKVHYATQAGQMLTSPGKIHDETVWTRKMLTTVLWIDVLVLIFHLFTCINYWKQNEIKPIPPHSTVISLKLQPYSQPLNRP